MRAFNTTCQVLVRHDKGLRDNRRRQGGGWACLLGSLGPAGSSMLAWRPVGCLLLCRLTQRALLLLLLLLRLHVLRSSTIDRRTYRRCMRWYASHEVH